MKSPSKHLADGGATLFKGEFAWLFPTFVTADADLDMTKGTKKWPNCCKSPGRSEPSSLRPVTQGPVQSSPLPLLAASEKAWKSSLCPPAIYLGTGDSTAASSKWPEGSQAAGGWKIWWKCLVGHWQSSSGKHSLWDRFLTMQNFPEAAQRSNVLMSYRKLRNLVMAIHSVILSVFNTHCSFFSCFSPFFFFLLKGEMQVKLVAVCQNQQWMTQVKSKPHENCSAFSVLLQYFWKSDS